MQVKLDYSLSSILGFLNDDRRPEKAQANQGCTFMDEEDGCSIDLYRNLNGGQNTNTAVKHESHLLKKKRRRRRSSTGCNFGGTIVISVTRQPAEETDKHAACGPRHKVSKTTVIPNDLPTPTPSDRLVMQVGFSVTVWQHRSRK